MAVTDNFPIFQDLFNRFLNITDLCLWVPFFGCEYRCGYVCEELSQKGMSPVFAFVHPLSRFYNVGTKLEYDNFGGYGEYAKDLSFKFHVAPGIKLGNNTVIFDFIVFDGPVTYPEWKSAFHATHKVYDFGRKPLNNSALNFSLNNYDRKNFEEIFPNAFYERDEGAHNFKHIIAENPYIPNKSSLRAQYERISKEKHSASIAAMSSGLKR